MFFFAGGGFLSEGGFGQRGIFAGGGFWPKGGFCRRGVLAGGGFWSEGVLSGGGFCPDPSVITISQNLRKFHRSYGMLLGERLLT